MQNIDHTKNIIEVENISFSYGNEEILKDINLNVHRGDYLAIIGPNGGGKTTLIKIMLGLLKPASGTIKLFGTEISSFKHWFKIGYVPQKAVHFDTNFPATAYEVVSMGRYGKKGLFHGLNQEDKEIINKSLKEVDMFEYRDKLIGDLSGGQQQRVFIARALSTEPEVIFLDEPTVGVDINTQEQFYELLKKLNKKLSLTLILISHDIDVVVNEATELACINRTLKYENNPQDFFRNKGLQKLYGRQLKFILHNH